RGGEIGVVDEQADGPGPGDGAAVLLAVIAVATATACACCRGGVGGGYRRGTIGRRCPERATVPLVAAVQHDRRRDTADEQSDGRGAEGEYRPGHGERVLRRGLEMKSAGLGRAEQAGHAEVDHGGQQRAEREAQRGEERGEVTAKVGTDG